MMTTVFKFFSGISVEVGKRDYNIWVFEDARETTYYSQYLREDSNPKSSEYEAEVLLSEPQRLVELMSKWGWRVLA